MNPRSGYPRSQKMQAVMNDRQQADSIPGATVSKFHLWRIEITPTTFP